MDENELLELLPKEAILELFKQRIVLTDDEFGQALNDSVHGYITNVKKKDAERVKRWRKDNPEAVREVNRRWYEGVKADAARHRAYLDSKNARHARRYKEDSEYRRRHIELSEKSRLRAMEDPVRREEKLAKRREAARRKRQDPQWVERNRRYARESYHRRKELKEAMKNEQD